MTSTEKGVSIRESSVPLLNPFIYLFIYIFIHLFIYLFWQVNIRTCVLYHGLRKSKTVFELVVFKSGWGNSTWYGWLIC